MSKIERFEDIEAWQLSRAITNRIYELTKTGEVARDFALVNQIRRASLSVLSNIAEGFERNGDKEFVQFLTVAKGSCGEVRAQLYIAYDQGYIQRNDFHQLSGQLVEVSRMISGLIRYLQASEFKGSKFKV
jgi:four helix bundle protein